jgi:hypothetical protein
MEVIYPLVVSSIIALFILSAPGAGFVSYNSRRNILGAITLLGKIGYHLFECGYDNQKSIYSVKLLRKSKWPSQFSIDQGNYYFL